MENRVVCLLFKRLSGSVSAFAEACYRFSPMIAVRPEGAVFLDLAGTENLHSHESLRIRLESLVRRFEAEVQIAFAPDAPTALARARFQTKELPLEALSDYVSPFALDLDLQKEVGELIVKLKLLGVQTLREFKKIPSASLASRFGKKAVDLNHLIRGDFQKAWPAFKVQPKVFSEIDIEEEENLESLLFVLRGLVDQTMARLRGRGERASTVQVEFELEKWSTLKNPRRKWRLDLSLPQGSATSLIPILREHLDSDLQRQGLEAPVRGLRFEVLEMVPGQGAQKDFFTRKEEEIEAWNALVGRLAHKIGKEKVFVAKTVSRYLPERTWVKSLESAKQKTAHEFPERPARVLKKPEPVQIQKDLLIHGNRRWKITDFQGPERVQGEWWEKKYQGFHRDYYRVLTAGGEKLWVFLDKKSKEATAVYLHGYFD